MNSLTADGKEFEERSDYIGESDLILWNVKNDYFENIQRELVNNGARLLVGPRGTGKTHQMKIAYQNCLNDNGKPACIFISLNKYFHLEPLLTKAPNALQIFHTWVLTKIVLGCYSFLKEGDSPVNENTINENISISEDELKSFESKAESPYSSQLDSDELIQKISISNVQEVIDFTKQIKGRQRSVILLDDAALTLTPDYFVEFLDIFRNLKTKDISPKASVYPGTTQYSPRFHVGHDAQFVNCWMSIEHERYVEFMGSLLDARFATIKDEINKDVLELLMYASFGVPRTFIGLIQSYLNSKVSDQSLQSTFNRIIDQRANLIESEYLTLKLKMPQFDNVLQVGWNFFLKLIADLKEENKPLKGEKNYVVGLQENENKMAKRMIGFLREAGLLYEEDSKVKHGDKREYKRFIPHLLFLIQNRTFNKGRGFNTSELLQNLKSKPKKHPLRRTFSTTLSTTDFNNLKLSLPPCQNCNTPRLTSEQKFCHNCGNQLVNQSTFERCLNMGIDELPLTDWSKDKIKGIEIVTIGDFLTLANPGGELRKIKGIGKVKSERITMLIQGAMKDILDKTLTDFLS